MTGRFNKFKLPDTLRGKRIDSGKIIPTACNVKNMLDKLHEKAGEYSALEQWEKSCYRHYNIEAVKAELLAAEEEERINILRRNILNNDFSVLGANPFDIYIVAYVAENIGIGREEFCKYCIENEMAGTENSAGAIYSVGKGDGVYLKLLNSDGTVKDWKFFSEWLRDENPRGIIVYNKLVRDRIPEIIMSSGRSCAIKEANKEEKLEFLKDKLKEEAEEFFADNNLEELADIMEVLFGLADSLGYSEEDLLKKRDEKREERGSFKEGKILLKVFDGNN